MRHCKIACTFNNIKVTKESNKSFLIQRLKRNCKQLIQYVQIRQMSMALDINKTITIKFLESMKPRGLLLIHHLAEDVG